MNPEMIEKIEQYLNNEMQPQERKDFEWQLQQDEELKNTMQLYVSINNTMKEDEISAKENEFTDSIRQMNRRYILTGGKLRKLSFKRMIAAAAVVAIGVIGILYYINSGKISPEKLYVAYARHSDLKIQLRGNSTDSIAALAAGKFNNKNYNEALPLLQQYLQQQPDDIQVNFSQGICYLELDMYSDAEKIFSSIAAGQSAYAASATWYLALSSLKQKDIEECRSRLRSIPENSAYYSNAKELLGKLPG